MNQFIIATHSHLAQGLVETVRFFKNDADNIEYLNCYLDDESSQVEKLLRQLLDKYSDKNVIVMTDIGGGSVNQTAARLRQEYGFKLIAGINFPLLLDLVYKTEDLTDEAIDKAVNTARQQLFYVNEVMPSSGQGDTEEL